MQKEATETDLTHPGLVLAASYIKLALNGFVPPGRVVCISGDLMPPKSSKNE